MRAIDLRSAQFYEAIYYSLESDGYYRDVAGMTHIVQVIFNEIFDMVYWDEGD